MRIQKFWIDLQLREQFRILTEFPFKSVFDCKNYSPKFDAKIVVFFKGQQSYFVKFHKEPKADLRYYESTKLFIKLCITFVRFME